MTTKKDNLYKVESVPELLADVMLMTLIKSCLKDKDRNKLKKFLEQLKIKYQIQILEELKKDWEKHEDGRYGWAIADLIIKLKELNEVKKK